jgi:putative ABC transport system permease protein
MNILIFNLKSAFFNFARSKTRTILASLGILIGVMSVILLISLGLGLKKYISQQFEKLSPNLLRILPGKVIQSGSFRGPPGLTSTRFDEKDLMKLKRINVLEYVIPVFTKTVTVITTKKTELTDIYAASSDIFSVLSLDAEYGRLFTIKDEQKKSRVTVLGPMIAEILFRKPELAVGKYIKIEKQRFKVIGVLKSWGSGLAGAEIDNFPYMPYTSAFVFNKDKKFLALVAQAKEGSDIKSVKSEIEDVMLKRYESDEFSVIEQTELLSTVTSIFSIINYILVAIASISLIVGGIGIMNIMYVTVTERIKEIGIRRAIGARKKDILYQFLTESVVLSLFGGITGLLLSFLIVFAIQSLFPAYINVVTVIISLGVSSIIGIAFGVFPAKKASDLSPIDAIRYE